MRKPESKYTITAKDATKAAVKSAESNLNGLGSVALKLGGVLLGVAGVRGMVGLVNSTLEANDALAKKSAQLGINITRLGEMHYITQEFTTAGVGAMDEALVKATKRLGEFNTTGGGAAAVWLKTLGLDTKALAEQSPDELFNSYADAIRGLNDRGQKMAAISALMGDESRVLIPIIDESAESLGEAAKRARDLGYAIDETTAKRSEEMEDAMFRIGASARGVANVIVTEAGPATAEYLNLLAEGTPDAVNYSKRALSGAKISIYEIGAAAREVGADMQLALSKVTFGDVSDEYLAEAKAGYKRVTELRLMIAQELQGQIDLLEGKTVEFDVKKGKGFTGDLGADVGQALNDKARANALKLQETMLFEEETLALSYARRAEMIQKSVDDQLISEERGHALMVSQQAILMNNLAKVRHQGLNEMQRFTQSSFKSQAVTVASEMEAMTGSIATHSRAAFEINKISSGAIALNNAREGASKTLAKYPQPLAGFMAAGHLLLGLEQVRAIESSSYGGGGAGGSVGGGGGTAALPTYDASPVTGLPAANDQGDVKKLEVHLHGDVYGWDDFMEQRVFASLKGMIADRDEVIFSGTSRQAAVVRQA